MTGQPAAGAGRATGAPRGRNTITSRALNRVAAAVSADALGVDAKQVSIDLNDHHGDIAITVRSPIRVPSLAAVRADPSSVARSGGSVLDRAASAQQEIGTRVGEITGSAIGPVTVRVTDATIKPERRVR